MLCGCRFVGARVVTSFYRLSYYVVFRDDGVPFTGVYIRQFGGALTGGRLCYSMLLVRGEKAVPFARWLPLPALGRAAACFFEGSSFVLTVSFEWSYGSYS